MAQTLDDQLPRTRLMSFRDRVDAQIALLDWVCAEVRGNPALADGPILEVGLGNGRTYSHLLGRLPGRRVIVFDKDVKAHPMSRPAPEDFVRGQVQETVRDFADASGRKAVMIHSDIGDGTGATEADILTWIASVYASATAPGALVLCTQALDDPCFERLADPVPKYAARYGIYRRV
ncbi:MAG: class I SAM-dependent methyltransferase [Pseudomonadota bacterium]